MVIIPFPASFVVPWAVSLRTRDQYYEIRIGLRERIAHESVPPWRIGEQLTRCIQHFIVSESHNGICLDGYSQLGQSGLRTTPSIGCDNRTKTMTSPSHF